MSKPVFLCKEHMHEWEEIHDWEGNPSLRGGTNIIIYWKCRVCGEETAEEPEEIIC